MTRLTVSPTAQDDIDTAAEYIAQDKPRAGLAFIQATKTTLETILEAPGIGRERKELAHVRLADIRSFPIRGFENWLVFYRSTPNAIEVVRILHGARDLKTVLLEET